MVLAHGYAQMVRPRFPSNTLTRMENSPLSVYILSLFQLSTALISLLKIFKPNLKKRSSLRSFQPSISMRTQSIILTHQEASPVEVLMEMLDSQVARSSSTHMVAGAPMEVEPSQERIQPRLTEVQLMQLAGSPNPS